MRAVLNFNSLYLVIRIKNYAVYLLAYMYRKLTVISETLIFRIFLSNVDSLNMYVITGRRYYVKEKHKGFLWPN